MYSYSSDTNVALLYSSFVQNPTIWQPDDVDSILFQGDSFYRDIVNIRYFGNESILLSHDDVPDIINYNGDSFSFNAFETLYGVVDNSLSDIGEYSFYFNNAFTRSFEICDCILITFNDMSIAAYCDRFTQTYFVFDSHARNVFGQYDSLGSAVTCMLSFSNIESVINYCSIYWIWCL